MSTFADYSDLPEEVRKHLFDLELFIGDLDGVETFDGTIDAEDPVVAFNGIVAFLKALPSALGNEAKE
jgi:hypothetical protein